MDLRRLKDCVTGVSWRTVVLSIILLPIFGCHHKQALAACPTIIEPDSITLRSAKITDDASFQLGHKTAILVTLQYTLLSQDSALLELNLDQFPSRTTCSKDISGMVRLLPATQVRISKGSRVIQVPLIWPGETRDAARGTVAERGTLSIEGALIADQFNYKLLTTHFGLRFCQQF